MWVILGAIVFIAYAVMMNQYINIQLAARSKGGNSEEDDGWSLGALAFVWLSVRAGWVLGGAALLIGIVKVITNK